MNYKLTIAYDGTCYHGWQRQKNGITVQEVLENSLKHITGSVTPVNGCSRTDAGVHAKTYVCNFFGTSPVPTEKIPLVLNMYLPKDIRAYKCEEMPDSFHARFDTVSKAYEYTILNRESADPMLRNFQWHYPIKLDDEKMSIAASVLVGKHDFASFCAAGSNVKSTVRTLTELSVKRNGDIITVRAAADGFLYNMVRILTGTLVYVGNGKMSHDEIYPLLEKGDRRLLGITAPPEGLALVEVNYA